MCLRLRLRVAPKTDDNRTPDGKYQRHATNGIRCRSWGSLEEHRNMKRASLSVAKVVQSFPKETRPYCFSVFLILTRAGKCDDLTFVIHPDGVLVFRKRNLVTFSSLRKEVMKDFWIADEVIAVLLAYSKRIWPNCAVLPLREGMGWSLEVVFLTIAVGPMNNTFTFFLLGLTQSYRFLIFV